MPKGKPNLTQAVATAMVAQIDLDELIDSVIDQIDFDAVVAGVVARANPTEDDPDEVEVGGDGDDFADLDDDQPQAAAPKRQSRKLPTAGKTKPAAAGGNRMDEKVKKAILRDLKKTGKNAMTQQEIADAHGVPKSAVYRINRAQREGTL